MAEPFFFRRGAGLTVGEIISLTGAKARPGADLNRRISSIAALDRGGSPDLSFFDNVRYAGEAAQTAAGICLTTELLADRLPDRVAALCVGTPYAAFIEVSRALFPDALRPSSLFEAGGVAPCATVHPSARMESGVTIDPVAVIGPSAEIGSGTIIGAGAVIGAGVRIGRDCSIGANVTISHALIGDRVIVHPGCAIGQDGFGFAPTPKGARKIPQVGRVIIQDDVEIGANSTVDRGALRDTVIGEGTKIDNLVQIAHNVAIGRHCLLAAQVGISGSSVLGDGVIMGGQAGVADHLTIGRGAMVGAQSGLMHDVPAGARWGGTPGKPGKQWLREVATLARLARARTGRGEGAE
ncbi:MAG TPA: UDP-3-O-(3-hydroxymyristoyl)glucosamine N-acyltransferase [Xanthobacteraceae bacterium]|jgi:UDP-3-O-[3-hydroxymyristoyl] glucosamine N-acyltransferase